MPEVTRRFHTLGKVRQMSQQFQYAAPMEVTDLSECYFYHVMDLPKVGTVGGAWDLRGRFDDYIGQNAMAGKSVLDIGTAAGFLTFEAEKRGARVVSFDMDDKRRQHFLPYKGHICYEDKEKYAQQLNEGYMAWKKGYWFAHRALQSKASVYYGDIYDLPRELGRFDVVIAGCIMMHLANPIQALESISRVSADKIVIIDTVDTNNQDTVLHLESRADNPGGHFIWFVLSIGLYREVFAMLSYDIVSCDSKPYICNDYGGDNPTRNVILTTITARRRELATTTDERSTVSRLAAIAGLTKTMSARISGAWSRRR